MRKVVAESRPESKGTKFAEHPVLADLGWLSKRGASWASMLSMPSKRQWPRQLVVWSACSAHQIAYGGYSSMKIVSQRTRKRNRRKWKRWHADDALQESSALTCGDLIQEHGLLASHQHLPCRQQTPLFRDAGSMLGGCNATFHKLKGKPYVASCARAVPSLKEASTLYMNDP